MDLTDDMRATIRAQLTAVPTRRSNAKARDYRFNKGRPYLSDALGVNPDQITEARDHLRSHGINAEFSPDGRAIIESEKQYQDIGRACGMRDGRDGWEPEVHSGNKMLTGRKPVVARRKVKADLDREIARYTR